MELYDNKQYEKCITALLNNEFSTENNLYIALSLYKLERYDASIKYFDDINVYFEGNLKSKENEFYDQMYIYADCLYKNKKYDTCKQICRSLIDNIPDNMKDLKESSYALLIEAYRDDIKSGYNILKEYINFGLGTNKSIFKLYWRKYAEYSEIINDATVYLELYKKYSLDSYIYICLKKNLLDRLTPKKNSVFDRLLSCTKKQFDQYENILIIQKDYVNLALYYMNYLHEPEKALTCISINADIISEAIKLFIQKEYKKFLEFFESNYLNIYNNCNDIVIYDCNSIDKNTLHNFFFKNENRIRRKLSESIQFYNVTTWKLIKGLSQMNINKYSEAIFELDEISKFNRNIKILLAISTYKNGDFFRTHLNYLKDLPDSGFTKRNLIYYYNLTKNNDKVDEIMRDYITQTPNNFACYYGIIPDIELKLFDRNNYGLLPIISLLYSKKYQIELIKLVDPDKIKKNNSKISLLQFVNIELNTKYESIEELCFTENMNLNIFLSLDEHINMFNKKN